MLTEVAKARWEENEPDVSDDISCVIVFFQTPSDRAADDVAAASAARPAAGTREGFAGQAGLDSEERSTGAAAAGDSA